MGRGGSKVGRRLIKLISGNGHFVEHYVEGEGQKPDKKIKRDKKYRVVICVTKDFKEL